MVKKTTLFLFLVLFLSSCANYITERPELIQPVSARIDSAVVDRGVITGITRRSGLTRLLSEGLFFDAAGFRLSNVYVFPGDVVTEGQLLASLDTTRIREEITELEEQMAQMRISNQRINLIRELETEILLTEHDELQRHAAVNTERLQIQINQARLLFEQERERQNLSMQQLEGRLQSLTIQLQGTELRAPFDGLVTFTNHSFNMAIEPLVPIIYIAPTQSIIVEMLDFTVEDILSIAPFIPAPVYRAVRMTAHINGDVFELTHIPLTREEQLFYGSNMPQPAAPAGWIAPPRFYIHPTAGGTLPSLGSYASIHLYSAWVEDALRIPVNALFAEPGSFHVYRIQDGRQIHTPIEIGISTNTFVEVLSGLSEGDEVYVRP